MKKKTIRQKKNVGDNLSPWPPQAIHNFEDQKEVSDDFLIKYFHLMKKLRMRIKRNWKTLRGGLS